MLPVNLNKSPDLQVSVFPCKMAGMEGLGMVPAPEGSGRGYILALRSLVLARAAWSVNISFVGVLVLMGMVMEWVSFGTRFGNSEILHAMS